MPTTPLRGWVYPNQGQNPYYATYVTQIEAQDADVHALYGVRSVALGGTGQSTLTAGAYLKGAGTSAIAFQTTPIPVSDGGTGASTFATGSLLYGNGAGAIQAAPATWEAGGGISIHLGTTWPYVSVAESSSNAVSHPALYLQKQRGTPAARTATQSGDTLGAVYFGGWGTSSRQQAFVLSTATETWSATAAGCDLRFTTTENGTVTYKENMRLTHYGGLEMGQGGQAYPYIALTTSTATVGGRPSLDLKRTRGTPTVPTATLSGDHLGDIRFGGYTNTLGHYAMIEAVAVENWSASTAGCDLVFSTTPIGTITPATRMTIGHDGVVVMEKDATPPYVKLIVHASDAALTYPAFVMRSSRGTKASPTATLINDGLFYIQGGGQTSPTTVRENSAEMYAYASESWTTTAQGSAIGFGTTRNGATVGTTTLWIDHDGTIQMSKYGAGGTRAMMVDNNGSLVRGAPLLVASVIVNSATYANSTAATVLKTITLPAGVLNVAGAVLQVDCRISVAVASACTYLLDIWLGGGRLGYTATGGTLPVSTYECVMVASCTTRTTGTSGTMRAGMSIGGTSDPGWTSAGGYGGYEAWTEDLTGPVTLEVRWTMSVANAGNTATLRTLNCWVTYPLQTVS
jgi:hypothetical protein